jgi:hypothetical protein
MLNKRLPTPFANVKPLTQVYDLGTTLKLLGLRSRQAFRQSGVERQIKSYPLSSGGKLKVYDAAEVREWAFRLARLRLAQQLGEIDNARYPLIAAPAGSERDVACPQCGAFARRDPHGHILCMNRHRTRPPL